VTLGSGLRCSRSRWLEIVLQPECASVAEDFKLKLAINAACYRRAVHVTGNLPAPVPATVYVVCVAHRAVIA
jgi:hypothetical protein